MSETASTGLFPPRREASEKHDFAESVFLIGHVSG